MKNTIDEELFAAYDNIPKYEIESILRELKVKFPSNCKKNELVNVMISHICDKEKFLQLFNVLSKDEQDFLIDFVSRKEILISELKEKYESLMKNEDIYFYYDYNKPLRCFISYEDIVATIPFSIFKYLRKHLEDKIPHFEHITNEEFVSDKTYFSEEHGLEFFEHFDELKELLKDIDFYKEDCTAVIKKGTVNKINKVLNFTPFMKEENLKELELDSKIADSISLSRVRVFLYMINTLSKEYFEEKNSEDFIKKLLDSWTNCNCEIFETRGFLPFVAWEDKGYGNYNYYQNKIKNYPLIINFLKQLNYEQPINFEELWNIYNIPRFIPTTNLKIRWTSSYYTQTEYIDSVGKYKFTVLKPALNNLILALTSFGLFEITWEYFDDDSDENLLKLYPYGKVKFFKMTDLGKFAFGLTDSFVFAQKNNISPIKLSSEFLAIECPSENKVASAYLFKTSTKIIGNTFFFEKKDILSNFNSQNAVQNFFKTLERYSSQDLPENWEKLKSECLSSSISIKIEDDWKILTLPSNPEVLQTFVSYQSVLKDKCLKVEGFKVAIKKDYVRNFLILLERTGFIIEE